MVFGNMGETSATGVAFTRDPAKGDRAYYGEFLINAQGEDVVAGIRTPQYLTKAARETAGAKPASMEEAMPETFTELAKVFDLLETHYRDMQDIEFTVQQGKLWMLQTRSGKRTAKAALKIAVDMAEEGLITREEAVARVDPAALDQLLHPTLDPAAVRDVIAKGLPASPGAASGAAVFDSDTAEKRSNAGDSVILIRVETSPGGHSRHARRPGHPDGARRHDQPRGGGRARHGASLRLRCRLDLDRREGRRDAGRRARGAGRRYRHHRRLDRRSDDGRGADRPARAGRRFRHPDGMGRRRAPPEGRAPMPRPRSTPGSRATSAPRAWASAAPSTCSSMPRASPRCAR